MTDPSQRNPVIDLTNITVVKASNGKYYNRQELDQSKEDGHNNDITYNSNDPNDDPNSDIVYPAILKEQFKENETTCPISSEELTKENAVRSRFGIYYDRASIERWISISHSCPQNKFFLDNTPKYLQPIDRPITQEPEHVTPQAAASLMYRFSGLSSGRTHSSNVIGPVDSNPPNYDGRPGI